MTGPLQSSGHLAVKKDNQDLYSPGASILRVRKKFNKRRKSNNVIEVGVGPTQWSGFMVIKKEDFSKRFTLKAFELRCRWQDGTSHAEIWRKSILGRGEDLVRVCLAWAWNRDKKFDFIANTIGNSCRTLSRGIMWTDRPFKKASDKDEKEEPDKAIWP